MTEATTTDEQLRTPVVVDFSTETPNTHLSTVFQCTPTINGRITPLPSSINMYILDFVDKDNHRLAKVPIDVYIVDVLGIEDATYIPPEDSQYGCDPGSKGLLDLWVLSMYNCTQLRDRATGKVVKTITFPSTIPDKLPPPCVE